MSGINTEEAYWNERFNIEQHHMRIYYDTICEQQLLPSTNFKPKIYKDGNMWCALYGDSIQEGICGFGETPEKAVEAYNRAWRKKEGAE